jgi:hypothetical protein
MVLREMVTFGNGPCVFALKKSGPVLGDARKKMVHLEIHANLWSRIYNLGVSNLAPHTEDIVG